MDSESNNKRIAKNILLLYFRMIFTMAVALYSSRVVLDVLGEKVCPVLHQEESVTESKLLKTYAAVNNDKTVQMNSSSGEVFTSIAKDVIRKKRSCFWYSLPAPLVK